MKESASFTLYSHISPVSEGVVNIDVTLESESIC